MPLDFVSDTDQKVPFFIEPKTAGGKPAKLDGKPTVTILSGGATFVPATEEESAADPAFIGHFVSEDTENASTYEVVADADLGEGVTEIKESGTYTYSAAAAVSFGARTGAAVPK